MKINKNDWHYKIQDRNGLYPKYSTNLCDYMMGLILALILELTKKILIPILLVTSPFIFIYYILADIPTTGLKGFLHETLFWISIIGIMIDTMIILDKICPIIGPYLPKWEKKEKIKKEKGPNILIEYLKAKKKKICPIIEFVDTTNIKLINRCDYKGVSEGKDLWDWEAFLDDNSSGELSNVDHVEYMLHPTYPRPLRKITNPLDGFVLKESGYGSFELKAFVHTKDGKILKLIHELIINHDPKDET